MNVRSEPAGTALSGTSPSVTSPSVTASGTGLPGTGSSGMISSGTGSSAALERRLLECHTALRRLEESCDVPAVRAAARTALAELRAALDSQAVDFPFFSLPEEAAGPRRGEPGAAGEARETGETGGTAIAGRTVEYATEHAGAA